MKKFLLFLVKCCCIFAISYSLFCILLIKFSNKDIKHDYTASHIDKLNRLSTTASPRVIFVGGSNLAFGLQSNLIKDSLKIEPVNMGVHAGIGLNYMLKEVIPFLKLQDILVIVPEYEQFAHETFYGEQTLDDLLLIQKKWKALIMHMNWITYSNILTSSLTSQSIHKKEIEEMYDRLKFNIYGDYVGHWAFKHHTDIDHDRIKEEADPSVINYFSIMVNDLRKKNINIVMLPPAYNSINYQVDSIHIQTLQKKLLENNIPFQAAPERYVFEDSLFYDTKYHLSKQGGEIRTLKLIEDLKRLNIRASAQ